MGRTNEALWKRVVAQVKAGSKGGDAGEWSARKEHVQVDGRRMEHKKW
jgi:hypothetical protein